MKAISGILCYKLTLLFADEMVLQLLFGFWAEFVNAKLYSAYMVQTFFSKQSLYKKC
jgi:hypothetical protein